MAYYNATRVLRLTRKALGFTQEKLSEDICEVENYSRIETGRYTLRRSVYQKLMEKMGRIPDRRYVVCVSKDGMLLEEKVELERAFKRYDYGAAEKYLQILKEKSDDNLLTRQYLARVDALVEYRKGRITAGELAEKLDVALRMTAPEYDKYNSNDLPFPFMKGELLLQLNIANARRKNKEIDESIKLYQKILECTGARYLGEPDRTTLEITVRNNLSMAYEIKKMYHEACKELDICLELAVKSDYGHLMATLLSSKASIIIDMIEAEMKEERHMEEAKKLSQQAYSIAVARGDQRTADSIKQFYQIYFPKEL